MRRSVHRALALSLLLVPISMHAQSRRMGSISGIYAQPQGEFKKNVDRGWGADGSVTLGADSRGIFGLRADAGLIRYNSAEEQFYVRLNTGQLVLLESSTTSSIYTLSVGPQLTAPLGPVSPYIGAAVGLAYFGTSTDVNLPANSSNTGQTQTLDSQTNSSDFVLSLSGNGGIRIALPTTTGFMLDIGLRYHRNGEAEYVTPAGVQYTGTGQPTITKTRSEANFVAYRVGLAMPFD